MHHVHDAHAVMHVEIANPRWRGKRSWQRRRTRNPVTWSFDVLFDFRLNKRVSKQSSGWWFETLSCPLWRHCNVDCVLSSPYNGRKPPKPPDGRNLANTAKKKKESFLRNRLNQYSVHTRCAIKCFERFVGNHGLRPFRSPDCRNVAT